MEGDTLDEYMSAVGAKLETDKISQLKRELQQLLVHQRNIEILRDAARPATAAMDAAMPKPPAAVAPPSKEPLKEKELPPPVVKDAAPARPGAAASESSQRAPHTKTTDGSPSAPSAHEKHATHGASLPPRQPERRPLVDEEAPEPVGGLIVPKVRAQDRRATHGLESPKEAPAACD